MNAAKITLFLTMCIFSLNAQEPFTIYGEIDVEQGGVIQIWLPKNGNYLTVENNKVKITNKRFTIKGVVSYPCKTSLGYTDSLGNNFLQSIWFYIEEGSQNIKLTKVDDKLEVTSNAQSFIEYTTILKPKINELTAYKESDLLEKIQKHQKDDVLFEYIFNHPQSYIGLNELGYFLRNNGYSTNYEIAYSLFDSKLKASEEGQSIKQRLALSKQLNIGSKFPDLKLRDTTNSTTIISEKFQKYTLIDFWFSSCGACIQQFPELKMLRDEYNSKGFEIVGVSVDKYPLKWREAINKHLLKWPQLLDSDSKQSREYLINRFPTNFLINSKGEILKKDISVDELRAFLLENR